MQPKNEGCIKNLYSDTPSTTANDNLLLRIRYLATKRQADNIVAAMTQFHHRVSENAIILPDFQTDTIMAV